MKCTAGDCQEEATTWMIFRGQVGHVHVCAKDEAIDREWCDVIDSGLIKERHSFCTVEAIHTSAPAKL